MAVLNVAQKKEHTENLAFPDEGLGMQRYDTLKYKQFDKLTDKQLGFPCDSEEVDIQKMQKILKI